MLKRYPYAFKKLAQKGLSKKFNMRNYAKYVIGWLENLFPLKNIESFSKLELITTRELISKAEFSQQ